MAMSSWEWSNQLALRLSGTTLWTPEVRPDKTFNWHQIRPNLTERSSRRKKSQKRKVEENHQLLSTLPLGNHASNGLLPRWKAPHGSGWEKPSKSKLRIKEVYTCPAWAHMLPRHTRYSGYVVPKHMSPTSPLLRCTLSLSILEKPLLSLVHVSYLNSLLIFLYFLITYISLLASSWSSLLKEGDKT